MKLIQSIYRKNQGWSHGKREEFDQNVQLVFAFGNKKWLREAAFVDEIMIRWPVAEVVGCSTSGEIYGKEVFDESVVVTAVYFEKTTIQVVSEPILSMEDSYEVGQKLMDSLEKDGLVHVFVISEGLNINGSELSKGLNSRLDKSVAVTGGMAGDQADFKETVVLRNGPAISNQVIAIGFYGEDLVVGHGSMGGWESFGVDREITKSKANILYELDNQPALELYKKYLGPHAEQLPASALLFPLSLKLSGQDVPLVRTVLSVDESDGSMVFAGDLPQGEFVRLMNANYDKLIDGAHGAALMSVEQGDCQTPELAILISCVGRKLVLKQRTEEELESVGEILGEKTVLAGFYSYGEICPTRPDDFKCELHNQTMTITTFKEL